MASASLILVIWSIGWLLYDELQLWQTFDNQTYQYILTLLIGVQSTISYIAAYKVNPKLTSLDKKELNKIFKRTMKKTALSLESHDKALSTFQEEIADLKLALKMKPETTTEATKQ